MVSAALEGGLEIIAVTDHNSVDWCDGVREAASLASLQVFPGVEISTPEGHLLAIFEKNTNSTVLREFLVRVGFSGASFGDLEEVSKMRFDEVCDLVDSMGGVAIASHVDGVKGFMKMVPTAKRRKQIHNCEHLLAVEIAAPVLRSQYQEGRRSGYTRRLACIQSSDSSLEGASGHHLDGIGSRFCYLKMDEVSINGLRQALLDPDVRIKLVGDPRPDPEAVIEGVWAVGGFLGGQTIRFNDNFTCLVGGTGTGKSLTIELIRFCLEQQCRIDKIAKDVRRMLDLRLRPGSRVCVVVRRGDQRYVLERVLAEPAEPPIVYRVENGGVVALDEPIDVPTFFPIKAYSQSEIIEFARVPEARLSLTDDLIDLYAERDGIRNAKTELATNASQLLAVERKIAQTEDDLKELPGIAEEISKLDKLLGDPRIRDHHKWYSEQGALGRADEALRLAAEQAGKAIDELPVCLVPLPSPADWQNQDILEQLQDLQRRLTAALGSAKSAIETSIDGLRRDLARIQARWKLRFEKAETKYQTLLTTLDKEGKGITAHSRRLKRLRGKKEELDGKERTLREELVPRRQEILGEREKLLNSLQNCRLAQRKKREDKANDLTRELNKKVVMRVDPDADRRDFDARLADLARGSYLTSTDISTIAAKTHPIPLVKCLASGDYSALADRKGVEVSKLERLRGTVLDRKRLEDLYELQLVDVEDVIQVMLQLDGGRYRDLEELAHGQRCGVILMVAMAEGEFPMLVDQPEEALHAPFIQDNIVSTLRRRRGIRQYVFATRDANLLVCGDAEQVVVLEADAENGWVYRTGAIDRFTTRDLVLYHVEGGEEAFELRRRKYGLASVPVTC